MLHISAPAKLNLFLHITGKRADGYHLLESLFMFTEYGDELAFEPADDLSLRLTGSFAQPLASESENLVLRAAHLLQQETGCCKGACITLTKNLPIGAGLGGGSADAAAALRGLTRLWSLDVTTQTLHALALKLGADVPACLASSPGWVSGIGENIRPATLPEGGWVVLINPQKPLLTADVFRARSGDFNAPILPAHWPDIAALATWAAAQSNALEAPARSLMPEIGELLTALSRTPCLLARMSGSGATCFGLYNNEPTARAAASALQAEYPGCWVIPTALKGAAHGQAQ